MKDAVSTTETVVDNKRRDFLAVGTLGVAAGMALFPKVASAIPGMPAVFNVKDFGALANGDENGDDAPSIQAAINAAKAVFGIVYFPASTTHYIIKSPLIIDSPIVIRGDGPAGSHIRAVNFSTSDHHVFDFSAPVKAENAEISGLTIRSNNGMATAIRLRNNSTVLIKDVRLYQVYDGVHISGTATCSIFFERFNADYVSHISVVFDNVFGNGQFSFVGCTFSGITGVYVDASNENVNNISFVNCNFETCTGNGFYTQGTVYGLSFTGCRTEACGDADFRFNPAQGRIVAGLTIAGCLFTRKLAGANPLPIKIGGLGGKVRGFNVSGNCVAYNDNQDLSRFNGSVFVQLNGEGESGQICGNYLDVPMAASNGTRPGVRTFSNESLLGKLPDLP